MNPTITNTSEHVGFDGPIGLSLLVAIGLLLTGLFLCAIPAAL